MVDSATFELFRLGVCGSSNGPTDNPLLFLDTRLVFPAGVGVSYRSRAAPGPTELVLPPFILDKEGLVGGLEVYRIFIISFKSVNSIVSWKVPTCGVFLVDI